MNKNYKNEPMTEQEIKKAILDIENDCKTKDTVDTEKFYQRIKGLMSILKGVVGGGGTYG